MTQLMIASDDHDSRDDSKSTEETTQPVGSVLLRGDVAHGLVDLELL